MLDHAIPGALLHGDLNRLSTTLVRTETITDVAAPDGVPGGPSASKRGLEFVLEWGGINMFRTGVSVRGHQQRCTPPEIKLEMTEIERNRYTSEKI